MNSLKCWYNGSYTLLSEVNISPLDFGFIHSEATYDVFRMRNYKARFLDLHLDRFINSCNFFGFEPIANVSEISLELTKLNKHEDAFIWLCCWRGAPPLSKGPRETAIKQHSLIYSKPYYPLSEKKAISIQINENYNRVPDSSYSQNYKNFSWIELTLAQKEAVKNCFDSTVVLSQQKYISEGPGFSICFIKGNIIMTPLNDCLKSITVAVVEDICKKSGQNFIRKDITIEEALQSDEAFACSTSGGITPINRINHTEFKTEKVFNIIEKYEEL